MAKLTKPQFIAALLPHALRVRQEGSPMFPSVRLAQNLLETGGVIHPWNNLGGIKVGSGIPNAFWKGQWVRKGTWEVENGTRVDTSANFRVYESVYHFYKDQDLLFQLPRYERVRKAGTPSAQAEALRQCGYATDPQYATKIVSLIKSYKLEQYDREVTAPEQTPATAAIPVSVLLNGKKLTEGRVISGQTWVPARIVGEALGMKVGYTNRVVTANGKQLPTQLVDNSGYVPIRDLVAVCGAARLTWDNATKTIYLTIK